MKVLIVDDHPLYRDGLAALVAQVFEGAEVGQAADAAAAFELLAADAAIDLMLLDLAIPGLDGRAALPLLRARHPRLRVVVVSATDDAATATACIADGAHGFVPKSVRREGLAAALQAVIDGGIHLSPSTPGAAHPAATPKATGLSAREEEVLARLCAGESNKQIARRLDISEGTVRAHLTAVFRHLGVASRTQALVEAQRRGLQEN